MVNHSVPALCSSPSASSANGSDRVAPSAPRLDQVLRIQSSSESIFGLLQACVQGVEDSAQLLGTEVDPVARRPGDKVAVRPPKIVGIHRDQAQRRVVLDPIPVHHLPVTAGIIGIGRDRGTVDHERVDGDSDLRLQLPRAVDRLAQLRLELGHLHVPLRARFHDDPERLLSGPGRVMRNDVGGSCRREGERQAAVLVEQALAVDAGPGCRCG